MSNPRPPLNPSRRSVAKGAAWAAPTIVVASAAPSLAASPQPACPTVPAGTTWTQGEDGERRTDVTGHQWLGNFQWQTQDENLYVTGEPNPQNLATWTETTFPTQDGFLYTVQVPIYWSYGNGNPNTSGPATMRVKADGEIIFSGKTRTPELGAPGTYPTYTMTFRATGDTTTLRYEAFREPREGATRATAKAQDDFLVQAPRFINCT